MSIDALRKFLEDMIVFLESLDKLLPDKVDPDLVSYLKGQLHSWELEQLHKSLPHKTK